MNEIDTEIATPFAADDDQSAAPLPLQKQRVILLSNVYNEEYLLPFWLNHHKNMFDHGIILDYACTDNSIEIIRRICPTWEILPSKNADFDAERIDAEFMELEDSLPASDYKIILNTTEFLCVYPNWRESLREAAGEYIAFKSLAPLSRNMNFYPHTLREMFRGITRILNFPYQPNGVNIYRSSRYMHSHPRGNYTLGRHTAAYPITNMIPGFIAWFGFYPWNRSLMDRKLQINARISAENRGIGLGFQHLWSEADQHEQLRLSLLGSKPLSAFPGFHDIIITLYP